MGAEELVKDGQRGEVRHITSQRRWSKTQRDVSWEDRWNKMNKDCQREGRWLEMIRVREWEDWSGWVEGKPEGFRNGHREMVKDG